MPSCQQINATALCASCLHSPNEFSPKEEYREFYAGLFGTRFLPPLGLKVGEQRIGYDSGGISPLPKTGPMRGHIHFEPVSIEKVKEFEIGVSDTAVLVDWQVPVPLQNKGSVRLELAEMIALPEGRLVFTGVRHGTKSTGIDFVFEPAPGFEGITSLTFSAYLRGNGKYYTYHGFEHRYDSGLSGTVVFDPVRYDSVKELELIIGRIQYTYKTEARVTVTPATIPQTLEAMGSSFVIDGMRYRNGQTLLHITYDGANRWFYNASFKIGMPPDVTGLTVSQTPELGILELGNDEELKQGRQRLQDVLGDYADQLLKNTDLDMNIVGTDITVSGEHKELEVLLKSLSAIRYSGEIVRIPLN